MSETGLKACMLALMGVVVVTLGTLVALGHNSLITDALMIICGSVGSLSLWERLKGKREE